MPTQTATSKSKENLAPIPINKDHHHLSNRANDAIARRAYALFLADGGRDGQDMQHWLRAESEILTRIPEIRESSSWYIVNIPLQGFSPSEIQVSMDEFSAIIAADRTELTGPQNASEGTFTRESWFLVAKWPARVDPSTASAYIKNEDLTLTVKRAELLADKG
jgi:HSP20 family molecular chaperone IbpA